MSEAAAPAAPVKSLRRLLRAMATRRAGQYSGVLGALVILVVLSHSFVQLRGADTDLWPRWYGLRVLLFEGRDPYSAAVTDEIVAQTSLASASQVARAAYGFVYPLPGALLLAPLAALPYEWAAAVWIGAGVPALAIAALLAVRAFGADGVVPGWRTSVRALPLAPLSVPAVWNVVLVQPGLAVVTLMAIAVWAARRWPFWAGVALGGAALLKPQLGAPLAGAWALQCLARWRGPSSALLLGGMATAVVLLCGCAFVLLPAWPFGWRDALRAYLVVPAMEPLSSAVFGLARLGPLAALGALSVAVTVGVGLALAAWALRGWTADARFDSPTPVRGVARTIVAGALLVPPAWETNAIVLLVPLVGALVPLGQRAGVCFVATSVALSAVLASLALVMPWRSGAVTIVAYAALWGVATWWSARRAALSASAAAVG